MLILLESNEAYIKAIEKNKALFDSELKQAQKLYSKGNTDEALLLAANLANFAWVNYCGFHTSYALEGLLGKISAQMFQNMPDASTTGNTVKKVLHVASEIYETGGHTPLMLKWIQRDSSRDHQLFLTRQSGSALPLKQLEKHSFSAGNIVFTRNNNESLPDVSRKLHEISSAYDLVVLHTHPDDVAPNIAFGHHKPVPVYILNHSDHSFWVGAAIADGLVQIRETNIPIDAERRHIPASKQFYLPIPLDPVTIYTGNTDGIKQRLGIENYETVLLTTSVESKFVFFKDYNYFEAILPVLDKNPQAVLIMAGIGPKSKLADKYAHKQIRFLGTVMPQELAGIEALADVYVENLPYSSFTALLQVFMKKKAVQLVYNPLAITQLFNDNQAYTVDKTAWQQQLDKLINDAGYRQTYSQEIFERNHSAYTPEAWKNYLEEIYKSVGGLRVQHNYIETSATVKVTDNEILLYKMLNGRYRYSFFSNKPALSIARWLNFISLKAKGYKLKKLF